MRNGRTTRTIVVLILGVGVSSTVASGQSRDRSRIERSEAQSLYAEAKGSLQAYEDEHERWLQTANVRMRYLEWPNPDGIPFIWIHGTYGNAFELMPVIDDLLEMGLWVLSIEYYGHGRTPIPGHPVTIYHVADDVVTLMDSLSIDRAIIGGFSRGGGVTAAVFDDYPERVLGLVLVDGGSFSVVESYDSRTDEEILELFATFEQDSTTYSSEFELFYEITSQWEEPTQERLFFALTQMSQGGDGRWALNSGLASWFKDDRLDSVLFTRRPSLRSPFDRSLWSLMPPVIFRHLDVPMLLIDPVRDADQFPVTSQNRTLQRLHPELVDHRIWPNTSHLAVSERPAWFLRDLGPFLDQVRLQVPDRGNPQ